MTEPIQTPEFWDGTADQYVASAEPFTAQFCEDAVLLADVEPGVALLDIATGPGALALAAARAGARVTAIDFSAEMIDRLGRRIGGLPITALRMDGQALDFTDDSFDRACSVFGIPLFPDWRTGLRELARVLRPGGRAVVAAADNGHGFGPNQLLAAARAAITGTPAPAQIAAWEILADRERFADEMHRAGLDEVVIHERTHDFELDPTVFVVDHPMILRNPVLAGLEQADRDAVIAAAIADAHRHADRGKLRLPGTALIAVATKP
jgi:ubiquinone/menaquinone biosynthesis C-methylase UbiE